MNLLPFVASVLAVGCLLLAGCTTQLTYIYEVDLLNTCGVPLQIESQNASNWLPLMEPRVLAPGKQYAVASYLSYDEDGDIRVDDNFSLTVKGSEQTRLFSAHDIRNALLGIKHERDGGRRIWTLKDGVFCP
ncbi:MULTISPECIES: hypothetical protein [Pseudomonas]|jgi:hypothetical protein|uniref:Uncharacterized protein n=1 Tax=Pseudomonas frederiksbergensis TaxID=104087 RepID=A0A6L5BP33_9PSED|nr:MULTISPECIES: hypothetical protein [Pseudomonas]KAF2389287.1 hypothetical protein FX983_03726 [Pseudomonas frederiksbergensis]MDN3218794.1 hypothetical protein [Pseudomonas nunensis]